jgi:predicted transposase YbfD/YdcC
MEKSLQDLFGGVADPRVTNRCRHKLSDILFIALSTLLCNGEDFEDMVEFAHQRYDWLTTLLELPGGIPSHDTFNRVLQRIDPKALQTCLSQDGQRLLETLNEKQISLDGKKIKGVSPGSKGNNGFYILSAWVSENSLCVGQTKVGDKSNEITAIPQLLDTLDIQEATISIDAIGCQKAIAAQIVDKQAEYFLALKKNQKQAFQHVEDSFRFGHDSVCHQEWEYDHGRYETRTCTVVKLTNPQEDEVFVQWKDLRHLVRIQASRQTKQGISYETRYYLSNAQLTNAAYFNKLGRGHWGIENQLHWHLDVTFNEDASRARSQNAPENLNILRKIALQRITQMKDKLSKKKRRYRASLNNDYLKELLHI